MTIKDLKYLKNNGVNPLYLSFGKMNGYFQEIHKNKYLILVPINESKEIIKKKCDKLWSKIRDLIRSKTKNSDDYDKEYMKIKFDWDDDLPLNKTREIQNVTIVVFHKNRPVFHKHNKYYQQVFLHECLYKL